MRLIKKAMCIFCTFHHGFAPTSLRGAGAGPIAGQRGPKSRTKRMILKAGRLVVCFRQKALPAMRITALDRLQRGSD